MALVVNTNVAAIQAQYNVSKTNQSMQDAMEALSSGKRINSAGDDAAGLSISTRMEAQVRGLSQAIRNANDGISLVDTAEGAMDEITSMLQRMRELAIQSSNGTLNDQDRANLDAEFVQLQSEIDRVVGTTRFNDQILLDGTFTGKTLQIGAKASETVMVAVADLSTASLGTQNSALSSAAAATSVTAEGTGAVENVVNLTFNGNDTYGLTFVLDGDTEASAGALDKQFSISGVAMAGSDASAIASAINTAIAGNATDATGTANGADLSGVVEAKAVGSTVSITVKDGTSLDLSGFTSVGAGSVTVNPVTNSSASSVLLEDVTEQKGLSNTGGTTATSSDAVLQLDEDKQYQFLVNGTTISVDGATGNGASVATAIQNAINATSGTGAATVSFTDQGSVHTYDISDSTGKIVDITGFQKITSAAVPVGIISVEVDQGTSAVESFSSGEFISSTPAASGGTVLGIADGKTGAVTFSNQSLKYTFDFNGVQYVVDGKDKDFQSELSRVATEIGGTASGISAVNNAGILEISNTTGSAIDFDDVAISAPGEAALTAGNAYFRADSTNDGDISDDGAATTLLDGSVVRTTSGVEAVASQMSLDVKSDDRFTFVIDKDNDGGSDATITADVLGGSLSGMINAVNAHSSTTGIVASLEGGQVVLTKGDGTAFAISTFSSEGNGKIVAANALGQGGAKTLENDGDGATASIAASGAAVATEITLQASGADKFSFQITDGTSLAVVRATDVTVDATDADGDGLPEMEDLLSEINGALSAANMSHITATNTGDVIKLVNNLGGKLEVTNFKSDGTETLTATPKVGQGVGTILNDDALAGASASVSAQSLSTVAGANSAIEVLDRAIENVNDQRSKLGAISNRLDHTVSNLGNIVTNTEASKSRIQDADFAAESANLAKNQILLQAGTAMLAQANASQQTVLSLLG